MRLNRKFLKSICKEKLHYVRFLNVSRLELVTLERVNECGALRWLIASDNKLQSDDGLENLKHLWYLDLSNNQIAMLSALSRYLALGTLILSNNNLKWIDLEKIRHAHIMSISLHGNPCLDSDPYYRIHVIDCLPLIWELDGRLVTVTERLHVKQFFIDTELSQHPVRHKMGRTFRTSAIKNIGTEGIVSRQCKYIYSKFPMSETHTKHTDERRLAYLTNMVQEDILQWSYVLHRGDPRRPIVSERFMDFLLSQRQQDPERCNMVMLLLVTSLQFELPIVLIRSVLSKSNLDVIGCVSTIPFFLLPPEHKTRVICVMLNAAKIQRDNNKNQTGGLYPQLFMCLYHMVAHLTQLSQTSEANMHTIKPIPMNSDYKALMAGEIMSLMLNVPRFYGYLPIDDEVFSLATCATGDQEIISKAKEIMLESEDIFSVMTVSKAHKMVKTMIMDAIYERLSSISLKMLDIPIGDRYLSLSDSLPIKPLHSVIWATEYLTHGQCVPRLDPPILYPAREAAKPKPQQPKIEDKVLLGPQVVGELTMILEGGIAMAKIDAVPLSNGAVESKLRVGDAHYTYVDLQGLCFARDIGMWRPIKTEGNTHTIHSIEPNELVTITQKEALKNDTEKSQPLIYTPRSNTLMVYSTGVLKSQERPQTSPGTEKKTKYRNAFSAGIQNTNPNCSFNYREVEDGFCKNNSHNQNIRTDKVFATSSDTGSQLNNTSDENSLTPHKDLSETADKTFPYEESQKLILENSATPVPSRSCSPALETLICAKTRLLQEGKETASNDRTNFDIGYQQGQTNSEGNGHHGNELVQVDSPPPTEKVTQVTDGQEHHAVKDTDTTAKVTWSDQVQGLETLEDSPSKIVHPDLNKDSSSSTIVHHSTVEDEIDSTFLTTVSRQAEGLATAGTEDKELRCPSSVDTPLSKATASKNIDLTFPSSGEMKRRPKTSKPGGTSRTKVCNIRKIEPERPQSATDVSYFLLNSNPTLTSGSNCFTGGSTSINESGDLKSEHQHVSKDAGKSSERQGRSRPITAAMHRINTGSLLPPPQRPTSPICNQVIKAHRLKVTSTVTWLGAGRDLYWEDVRGRPKSGHTPGWKEGLPEDMRKRRSKSAYVTSNRSQLLDAVSMASCTNYRTLNTLHDHPDDMTYLIPQTRQLLQYLPPPVSSPSSEDHHNTDLMLDPDTDTRSSLHIQGLALSRRHAKVPNDDDLGFAYSQANYHYGSFSNDQLMPVNLDDQDLMCVQILPVKVLKPRRPVSPPVKVLRSHRYISSALRAHNSKEHVAGIIDSDSLTGLGTDSRVGLSMIHPHSASNGDLNPTTQGKCFKGDSRGQSSDTSFASGIHGRSIVPQSKSNSAQQATRNSSASRDFYIDSLLADGNSSDSAVLSHRCEDTGSTEHVVKDATNDDNGGVQVKIGEGHEGSETVQGERLVLHVNLRIDLDEGLQ